MKKCPFCGAAVEENARFCLYCMKELEEKAVMDGKRSFFRTYKTRLLLIGGAVLLAIAILLLVSQCSGFEPDGSASDAEQTQADPANGSAASTETSADGSSLATTSGGDDTSAGATSSVDTSSGESSPAAASGDESQHTSEPSSTYTPSEESSHTTTNGDEPPSISDTPSDEPEESSHASASSDEPPSTSESSSAGTSSDEPETSTSQPPAEQVTYTYRDAQFYNLIDAADRADKGLLAQNAVVITGVEPVSKSGVYVIPEVIDGKKVVAVMEGAFSDAEICHTVKKVVLPASIHSVWETFQYCDNLTDLYVSGSSVVVTPYAFSLIPNKRQLTVHGASACVCYYGSIGKTTLKERAATFGIGFQAWNGGTL